MYAPLQKRDNKKDSITPKEQQHSKSLPKPLTFKNAFFNSDKPAEYISPFKPLLHNPNTIEVDNISKTSSAIQLKPADATTATENQPSFNHTGIPPLLKKQFETTSGFSFDDVKVHYNSDKPMYLQALAYTQGNQVYVCPGQEKHLSHELGHVVQQKAGMVKPTGYIDGVAINENEGLEHKADNNEYGLFNDHSVVTGNVVQRQVCPNMDKVCVLIFGTRRFRRSWRKHLEAKMKGDTVLLQAYSDAKKYLPMIDFVEDAPNPMNPGIDLRPLPNGLYPLHFKKYSKEFDVTYDEYKCFSFIIHELMHLTAAMDYSRPHVFSPEDSTNMKLVAFSNFSITTPGHVDPMALESERYAMISDSSNHQIGILSQNWEWLQHIIESDTPISWSDRDYLCKRIDYACVTGEATHYDTVLLDMLYYMKSKKLQKSNSYAKTRLLLNEANIRRNGPNGGGDVELHP